MSNSVRDEDDDDVGMQVPSFVLDSNIGLSKHYSLITCFLGHL